MDEERGVPELHAQATLEGNPDAQSAAAQDVRPSSDNATPDDSTIKDTVERLKRLDEYKVRTSPELRVAFNTLGGLFRDLPATDYLLLESHALAAWCLLREHDPSIYMVYRATVRQKCGKHVVDLLDIAMDKSAHIAGMARDIVALDVNELLSREFPPMETLLTPWLRRQCLVMVHAKRGVGKTHFGLGIAHAVASGGAFLKWQADKPRPVLYIDGEMPGIAIKERLSAIKQACGNAAQPTAGCLRIVTPDVQSGPLPDLGTPAGQAAFAPVLGDAELIVVDNLSSLVRSGVENEGESWLPVADWALALRREGRAVIFIHHSGKNGLQRGSSRREDLLDVVINLRHSSDYVPEHGAQFLVRFEKSRGIFGDDVREFEAVLTTSDGGIQAWSWQESETANFDRILTLHKLEMSMTDIAAELECNKSTVSRAIKKAREIGIIPPKDNNNGKP